MSKTLIIILSCCLSLQINAQSSNNHELIERACLDYLEGFYDGDTSKLIRSLNPNLYKFGYWKNDETSEYDGDGHMTFEQAVAYSKRVFETQKLTSADAPKEVEILHIAEHIAAAKVTAWWGIDYVLLAKNNDQWQIEEVLWEGPLAPSHFATKPTPYEEYKANDEQPYGVMNPDAPAELADYSELIGQCDCLSARANAAGEFGEPVTTVWQFKYIMNGMAIQDETWREGGGHTSSIRQFNQDSMQWHVTFFSSNTPTTSPTTWSGDSRNGEDSMCV